MGAIGDHDDDVGDDRTPFLVTCSPDGELYCKWAAVLACCGAECRHPRYLLCWSVPDKRVPIQTRTTVCPQRVAKENSERANLFVVLYGLVLVLELYCNYTSMVAAIYNTITTHGGRGTKSLWIHDNAEMG